MNAQRELRSIFLELLVMYLRIMSAILLVQILREMFKQYKMLKLCKIQNGREENDYFHCILLVQIPREKYKLYRNCFNCTNSKWKRMTIFTARKVVASINIWVRTDKNYRDALCNHSHRHHTQDWKSTQGVTKTQNISMNLNFMNTGQTVKLKR